MILLTTRCMQVAPNRVVPECILHKRLNHCTAHWAVVQGTLLLMTTGEKNPPQRRETGMMPPHAGQPSTGSGSGVLLHLTSSTCVWAEPISHESGSPPIRPERAGRPARSPTGAAA